MTRTTACKRSQNDDETNGAKRQKITVNVPRRSSNRITRLSTSKMLDDEQIVNAIVSSMGSKLSEKKVLSEKTKINSSANQQNICSKELLSDFELARTSLHVKTVPKHLPCRENEHFDLLRLIESNITSKEGSCIYISGVPGTGKTATVKHVIRELLETPAVKNFDFYEINGMKLSDPTSAFSNLSRMIFKKKFSISQSIDKLEKKFTNNKKNKHTVILVDELDLLVTKNQKVIYNFFDWPSRKNSNLTVIAIANTMDLPERVLLNRVASRLGLTRINFTPYDYNQLIRIVEARLEQIPNAFDADSILYCAKKVSAVSGDARKALDICRRAVEILQSKILQDESPTEVITFEIMQEAVKELFSTSALQFLMCS
ncbi:Origin recognition complex, subunit 1 [Clydaea vesicula]|uniref:Origin recognition complex subunit 1 n=1 Tax=Clydaea vesicula TaxID=447962 RepID=A0AAD5Y1C0_9FUNG|nr:Origin recognition complex, subunit 1 [Clydaea vesicula]KAJ3395588.1 Origin recognition complex, subunit 1 [Lobulomyces angularis]